LVSAKDNVTQRMPMASRALYVATEFDVDSSSRFPLRAPTHTHRDRHTESQTRLHQLSPWRFLQPCDLDLWPFDLRVNAWQVTAMCTKFDVDSSSRFPLRARTHTDRHTVTADAT